MAQVNRRDPHQLITLLLLAEGHDVLSTDIITYLTLTTLLLAIWIYFLLIHVLFYTPGGVETPVWRKKSFLFYEKQLVHYYIYFIYIDNALSLKRMS